MYQRIARRYMYHRGSGTAPHSRTAIADTPDIGGADSVLDSVFLGIADELEDVTPDEADRVSRRISRDKEAAGIGLIISIVLSLPKISELVGAAINKLARFLSSKFGGGEVNETKVGNFLVELGHKLEHRYVALLKKSLWALSKTPIVNKKLHLDDVNEKDLERVATILFYAILVIAAGNAFSAAASSMGSILGGLEAALGSVKAGEVVQAVRKIMG